MKRPTLVLLGIVVVAIAGYGGYRMLASDETRIRWLLEDTASSFNDTHLGGCLAAFAPDYQDKTISGMGRAELTQALRYVFLRRVDPKTRQFLFRVRIPEQDVTIKVAASGNTATAQLTLHLEAQRQDTWEPVWELRVTAGLGKVNGDWRIQRSSHETLSGRIPR
ncbi:MAG: hypothetical protein ACYTGW_07430 [Planctomycetota bacterium]|jgi:hypothetical protein